MTRTALRHALLAAAAALAPWSAAGVTAVAPPERNPWTERELTRAELQPAAEQGADYLLRNQLADGQFVYIKDPLGRCCRQKGDKYSLIRHLGGVYALLRAYELTRSSEYLQGARAGLDFAWRFRDADGVLRGLRGRRSIGENGFLLLDAVLYDHLAGGDTYGAASDALVAFVRDALVYGGPFATSGQWAECQAIMGLMLYHRLRRADDALVVAARRWLTAMAAEGRHSHWSMQAILALATAAPAAARDLPAYALAGGHELLQGVLIHGPVADSRRIGARHGKLLSCNATARNEGLIACHALARQTSAPAAARFYLDRIREHLAFAMQFQYGQPGGLLERNTAKMRLADLFDLRGGVFNDADEAFVRIDFVAHHVRALAAYLLSGAAPASTGVSTDELAH